jgi:hypothetical protein
MLVYAFKKTLLIGYAVVIVGFLTFFLFWSQISFQKLQFKVEKYINLVPTPLLKLFLANFSFSFYSSIFVIFHWITHYFNPLYALVVILPQLILAERCTILLIFNYSLVFPILVLTKFFFSIQYSFCRVFQTGYH